MSDNTLHTESIHMSAAETDMGVSTVADPTPISPDLLARAFIDILARAAGAESRPLLRKGTPDDPIEHLLNDLSSEGARENYVSIRPDVAAVAILTARAVQTVPGLIKELRRGNPIVTLATRNPEIVGLVAEVLEQCAFGPDVQSFRKSQYPSSSQNRTVLTFVRDGTATDHKPEKGNEAVASALHAQSPIIGVAPDPRRHLPRDLMRTAEHHLVLGDIDERAVSLVIEAVTGYAPQGSIAPELISAIDVSDLQLALRKHQTPDECLKRLSEIVRSKGIFDDSGPRLEELFGYGLAKDWGLNLAADLAAYKRGRLDWASIDKGLLLDGPPGVGKTQYAKALARTAGVPLVATSVADWNTANYLSGTLQAMRTAFAQAGKLAPAILFIDELDGISDRTRLQGDYVEYWSQIVNLLLEMLAGTEDRPGVVVIAATNHPDRIDPAVRRAGRLDRTITIARPGTEDLFEIFRFHLKKDLVDADIMPLALAAEGSTGADVDAWVRRGRSHARRANRDLTTDDILQEIRGQKSILPPDIQQIVTIHEAGHIVVGAALRCYEPTRVWLTETGGRASGEINTTSHLTLRGLEKIMTMLLAGRAAEKLLLGPEGVTVGASLGDDSDLGRATQIACDIETRFGMGQCGLAHFPDRAREMMLHDKAILAAIQHRLDKCHLDAENIIQEHHPALVAIAVLLQDKGYVERAALVHILQQHDLRGSESGPEVNTALSSDRAPRSTAESRGCD